MSVDTKNAVALNGLTAVYVMALYIIKNLDKNLYRTQLYKATLAYAIYAIARSLCFFTKTKLGFLPTFDFQLFWL